MNVHIRPIPPNELEVRKNELAELLVEAINDGASLGFLPPLSSNDACAYWLSLETELRAGVRLLLGAFLDDTLVGAGQLFMPAFPNALHRAEIHKLVVAGEIRGRSVGTRLMMALHDAARARGRDLILLRARRGGLAESFYRKVGYREAGVLPGYSLGRGGQRHDSVAFYHELIR